MVSGFVPWLWIVASLYSWIVALMGIVLNGFTCFYISLMFLNDFITVLCVDNE